MTSFEGITVSYKTPIDDDFKPLEKIAAGGWIDCRAAEDFEYVVREHLMIPLGFAAKLPKGYEAYLAPRSSTFKKYGLILTNSLGIIDESYCGDNDQWYASMLAMRSGSIKRGDRICQFRITPVMPSIILQTVDHLPDPDRGGFGSTGVN